jgi:hypothetical protein
MLEILATAANEMEAAMISGRLSAAGIRSMEQLSNQGSAFGRFGGGGARDVYVEASDLERARGVLADAQEQA